MIWLYRVRIPALDFTDVVLASEDIEDHDDHEDHNDHDHDGQDKSCEMFPSGKKVSCDKS